MPYRSRGVSDIGDSTTPFLFRRVLIPVWLMIGVVLVSVANVVIAQTALRADYGESLKVRQELTRIEEQAQRITQQVFRIEKILKGRENGP